ncbi:hypothetical protein F5Y19DRAFT_471012 [Xylariaceae sp. FL1651]|nr:hypothetical protein F5Y19DRAFT_471012 [Xylariaceae sp. FL1651]
MSDQPYYGDHPQHINLPFALILRALLFLLRALLLPLSTLLLSLSALLLLLMALILLLIALLLLIRVLLLLRALFVMTTLLNFLLQVEDVPAKRQDKAPRKKHPVLAMTLEIIMPHTYLNFYNSEVQRSEEKYEEAYTTLRDAAKGIHRTILENCSAPSSDTQPHVRFSVAEVLAIAIHVGKEEEVPEGCELMVVWQRPRYVFRALHGREQSTEHTRYYMHEI